MKGARPEQAALTRDTDMSKTDATRSVIEGMVDGLNDHRIDDIGEFFAEDGTLAPILAQISDMESPCREFI